MKIGNDNDAVTTNFSRKIFEEVVKQCEQDIERLSNIIDKGACPSISVRALRKARDNFQSALAFLRNDGGCLDIMMEASGLGENNSVKANINNIVRYAEKTWAKWRAARNEIIDSVMASAANANDKTKTKAKVHPALVVEGNGLSSSVSSPAIGI